MYAKRTDGAASGFATASVAIECQSKRAGQILERFERAAVLRSCIGIYRRSPVVTGLYVRLCFRRRHPFKARITIHVTLPCQCLERLLFSSLGAKRGVCIREMLIVIRYSKNWLALTTNCHPTLEAGVSQRKRIYTRSACQV